MPTLSSQWLAKKLHDLRGGDEPPRYLCAYSGGLDSSVLLHAAAAIPGVRLRAIHVNHGLHEDAERWSMHARKTCRGLNVDVVVENVEVAARGNIEALARRARYAAIASHLASDEYLLTAHHQDDQFETVLLQLLRGAGPAGLAAMPERAAFAKAWHLRPLLALRRRELSAYAERHRLAFCEDASNEARRFDRNYLRHEVLPVIAKRWPSAAASVSRSAALAAGASTLLRDLAELDCDGALQRPVLEHARLADLSAERLANVVREWLRIRNIAVPNHARLIEFVRQLREAGNDRHPSLCYDDVVLRAFDGQLHHHTQVPAVPSAWSGTLAIDVPLSLPGGLGMLHLAPRHGAGMSAAVAAQGLRVAFRAGGEKLRVSRGGSTVTVKNLLSRHRVLPWLRSRIPLLWSGERLAAVADLWRNRDLDAARTEKGYAVVWTDGPNLLASAIRQAET